MSQARIRNLVVVLVTLIVLGVLFVLLRPQSSAPEGDQVTLQIISDHPIEVHLHGYDLEEVVGAEEPGELSFEATMTGRFPIEDHDTEAELGTLLVQPR